MGYWLVVWQDVFTTILSNSHRDVPYHPSEVFLLQKKKQKKYVLGARAGFTLLLRHRPTHKTFTGVAVSILGASSVSLLQMVLVFYPGSFFIGFPFSCGENTNQLVNKTNYLTDKLFRTIQRTITMLAMMQVSLHQKRFKNQYQFLQRHLIPDNYRDGGVSKS